MDLNKQDQNENHEKVDENQKIYPHQLPLLTLLTWFIGILNGKAWEYLGLMMNPETKETKSDLEKAKISIDCIEYLFNQIQNELEKEERNQFQNLLANLKINYVEKKKETGTKSTKES